MLAAGRGKRFWPIMTSKSQVTYLDRPLVVHNLLRLKEAGFHDVVIVINPVDVQFYMSLSIPGFVFKTVIQQEALGMGDALLRARDHIGDSSVLVINAEDVVEMSLYQQIIDTMKEGKPFLCAKAVDTYFDGGYLEINDHRVVGIIEKPGERKMPSTLVNLVFHYLPHPKDFFTILEKQTSDQDDAYEKALEVFVKREIVGFIAYSGSWFPTKYPWHVLDVSQYFLRQIENYRGKDVSISANVTIEGPVYIDDNVKIFEHTKIVGPAYIGKGSIIGNNNIIRKSHIGTRCVTGFNTDITRSYVGDDCWFHSNYIGDSVLEGNVGMGSGAVLANLRLDEGEICSIIKGEKVNTRKKKFGAVIGRNVRIGVNASVMPGVKIGGGSFVGAGVILDKDLPDNKFCMGKIEYIVIDNTRKTEKNTRDEFRQKLS